MGRCQLRRQAVAVSVDVGPTASGFSERESEREREENGSLHLIEGPMVVTCEDDWERAYILSLSGTHARTLTRACAHTCSLSFFFSPSLLF